MENSDVIATASVVVAGCALFVSIYQSWLSRQHNKLQVRPVISIESSSSTAEKFIAIHNLGLGPALIKKIVATYKGLSYDLLTQNGLDQLTGHVENRVNSVAEISTICLQTGAAIAPGGSEKIVLISKADDSEVDFIDAFILEVVVNVSYECVYRTSHQANNITA